MANWISSKLKVAENLLQQIDQQAAESLRKSERKQNDELDFSASAKPIGSVPLRDQLKKKRPESNEVFGKLNCDYGNFNNAVNLSSDDNISHQNQRGKEVAKSDLNSGSSALKDSDWTELLGDSKQLTPTKTNRANGLVGTRFVKKVGGKVGNLGLNVKGNGRAGGTARKTSDGNAWKGKGGVGDGGKDREDSRNSCSFERISGVESDNSTHERLGSSQDLGKLGNQDGKKEVERERDITGKRSASLNSEELAVASESPSLVENTTVLGSNGAMIALVGNNGKEAFHDDGNTKRAALKADNTNMGNANYGSGDLKNAAYSGSNEVSDSDSESSSLSDSEIERERKERIQRRRQVLAAKATAKAAAAIKEQENLLARLEGEKQSLEKILEERAKQAAQEVSELQSTMKEKMEAAELEKQKHNLTRMEVLGRLAKLETTNADLAKYLAIAQWNLEIEVNRVAKLRQEVEAKEFVHEELKRRISSTNQTKKPLTNLIPSIELEKEMLEAEYSLLTEKITGLQDKATNLEVNIDLAQNEMENSTEIEAELKQRLRQMTDHLIQKQSQVEALSSDKAMLLFRMEAVSRLLAENKSSMIAGGYSDSSRQDVEMETWEASDSKMRPMFEGKFRSGKQHLGSVLRQLDAIFSAGEVFLARNPAAKLWSVVYLVCLHLWVLYILFSRSRSTEDSTSSSVLSLDNINNINNVVGTK